MVRNMLIHHYAHFYIYSFLGWCVEVVYAALTSRKFVNRGFLNGPVCPIYGFGVIAVVYLLEPVSHHIGLLFLGSVLVTSAIELVAGVVLEKLFHQKWWDYSKRPFNLGGYICPLFSLLWGMACLIVVYEIHPMVTRLVKGIPDVALMIVLAALTVLLVIDLIATVHTILKFNRKLERIEALSALIRKVSDSLGDNLATGAILLAEKKDEIGEKLDEIGERLSHQKEQALLELKRKRKELIESRFFGQMRLLKAFPGLNSRRYKEALKLLKEYLGKK